MAKNEYAELFSEAAQALFDTLEPEQQSRSRIIGRMHTAYIGTQRDKDLDLAFNGLIENAAAALFGKAGKRRALFIVGEAGSGKTTAVERHISKRVQFAPRKNAKGDEIFPMVWFEAPKPLTLKGLAKAGLAALDYEVLDKKITEQELFDLWKQQLRESSVLFLWVDEMQHVLKGTTTKEIQNVADIIKSLVQIEGWPLHLVLSGVPALAQFLHQSGESDRQLPERSMVVELKAMTREDAAIMRKVLVKIVTNDAELQFGKDILDRDGLPNDNLVQRLMHASNSAFGSTIQMVRFTCEQVLRLGQEKITLASFASAYALATGCRREQNVFLSDAWEAIVPDNALGELLKRVAEKEASSQPKKIAAIKRKVK